MFFKWVRKCMKLEFKKMARKKPVEISRVSLFFSWEINSDAVI